MMSYKKGWLGQPHGKKLRKLHAWNAWTLLLLAASGAILYVPSIRGELGAARVWLKQLHIALGIFSIALPVLYIPLMRKHWLQLRQKWNQRGNLLFVLFLLFGWSVSGLILWQFRSLPPAWSGAALFFHDAFTWIGVPYALYHSLSRSRWVKRAAIADRQADHAAAAQMSSKVPASAQASTPANGSPAVDRMEDTAEAVIAKLKQSRISRGTFIRWAAGLLLIVGVGPYFYRWLKGSLDNGGTALQQAASGDGNHMVPAPTPLPDSATPAGGGAQGNFRIYTVTEIPSFSSDTWKFAISGLVANLQTYSWSQFLEIPRKVQVSDFHCVTGWSVYRVTWEGIPLSQLLDAAKVDGKARFVKFYSGDGVYTDTLTLEQARMEDVMVAVLMDGRPIPQKLGGPVRLVVPKMYAYKSVKWLQGIELIEREHIGYWEVRGYDIDAWVHV
jgi:DMSO/TMAO reductase YedYZ molybdopterin-dependent catalytic subunit